MENNNEFYFHLFPIPNPANRATSHGQAFWSAMRGSSLL